MKKYGYVRVSTPLQNIDRQTDEMLKLGLLLNDIYIDRQSGKDFERDNYQKLRAAIKKDDLLIIKSIDRLGRNYKLIVDEWYYLTKIAQCDIFVIDMPLLDTRAESKNLVGKFISDIVLQILSFVAETERDNIKQRQAEGIRLAKQKGKHLGRPNFVLPPGFRCVAEQYRKKTLSLLQAAATLNMPKATFYKYCKRNKSR
jgi:DNA invertase Pin-like site-specific DNA recombinase